MEAQPRSVTPCLSTAPPTIAAFELDSEVIRERFRWARRRGHPMFLWPDLSFDQWKRATSLLARVTRVMITPDQRGRLDLPDGLTTRAVGIAAFATGVGPLFGHWLQTNRLETDDETAELLALHLDQGRKRFARIKRFATDALRVLRQADPDAVVLKGLHTAQTYFPDPGTRPVADVDVLIAQTSVGRAEEMLREAAFIPTSVLRSPYRRDWVRSENRLPRSLEVDHEDNPMALDLHGSLARVFSGTRRVDLASRGLVTTAWKLENVVTRVLAQPLLTAFLAMHASEELHHLRLIRLYELISVIRHDLADGSLDWRALAELLRATESARFCYPALAVAEKLAPGTVAPSILSAGHAASGRMMRRIVARLEPETCLELHRRSFTQRFMWAATPLETVRCAAYAFRPGHTNAAPLRQVLSERFFRVIRGRVSMSR